MGQKTLAKDGISGYNIRMKLRTAAIKLFNKCLKTRFLYRVCRKYCDLYDNENNCDIRSNGELLFLSNVLDKNSVAFDVGANKGDWVRTALEVAPGAYIHCFEPGRADYDRLKANDFPPNVTCGNTGLGSKRESRTLFKFGDGSGLNSLYRRVIGTGAAGIKKNTASEDIELTTLDDYCLEKGIDTIDFLKVDVEGNELEVLKGGLGLMRKGGIKIIQFEYGASFIDAGIFLKDIFALLEDHGFALFKIFPGTLKKVGVYRHELDNFRYANYAAIHRSAVIPAYGNGKGRRRTQRLRARKG